MTRAAELYDSSRPCKFVSYASFRIRMEINRAASLKRGGVYIPKKYYECGTVRDADEVTRNALSEPVEYPAHVEDLASVSPEAYAVAQEERAMLRSLIDTLPPRWRTVMTLRFLSPKEPTLLQVGKILGVSRQRVEQIEVRAVRSMRMTYLEWQR
jgi:RNA polymerase sigma factor (sigma-70 family)